MRPPLRTFVCRRLDCGIKQRDIDGDETSALRVGLRSHDPSNGDGFESLRLTVDIEVAGQEMTMWTGDPLCILADSW